MTTVTAPDAWRAWLDDPDALAALGTARGDPSRFASTVDDLLGARRGTLVFAPAAPVDVAAAAGLGAAWRAATAALDGGPHNEGLRLEVEAATQRLGIVRSLARASGVQSVCLLDRSLRRGDGFGWPLRVAFGPAGALRDAVTSYRHQHLLAVQDEPTAWGPVDLLVIEPSELALVPAVRPRMVLLVLDDAGHLDLPSEPEVRSACSLWAMVVRPDPTGFVGELLDGLAHNFTVDRAIGGAAHAADDYVVAAHPAFLRTARISHAVARLRHDVETAYAEGSVDTDVFVDVIESLRPIEAVTEGGWLAETREATFSIDVMAEARRAVEPPARPAGADVASPPRAAAPPAEAPPQEAPPARRPPTAAPPGSGPPTVAAPAETPEPAAATPPPPPPERHLQAQVYARMPGLTQRLRSFEPATAHKLVVRVGATSVDWHSVPADFPYHALPPDETSHLLTVHLVAPGITPGPLHGELTLGASGDSSAVEFDVHVPAELASVDATIIVYRGTTHLQTATLRAPVAAGDVAVDGRVLEFLPGDGSGVDLDARTDPMLSLRLTTDVVWVKRPGEEPYEVHLPNLSGAVDAMRDVLYDVATRMDGLRQPLSSENGTRLVRTLAAQGEYLRRLVLGDDRTQVTTVEVTSPSSGTFLPVEFFYDHVRPEPDAVLCPGFATGEDDGCPDCRARSDAGFVCPSGFWALRTSIERQVRSTARGSCIAPEPSEDALLPATRRIVFAASERVNTSDQPTRLADTIAALEALPATVHVAGSWHEWRELVGGDPTLLVALPHNVVTEARFPALQVGREEDRIELALNAIDASYVGPATRSPGPLMLLLGCNVANPTIDYQDFIRQLRCSGASLVIGTLTYVLGQQAAPFATALVEALFQSQGDEPFGDILRKVRARMLRADNPMALAVTAFGAADWRFASSDPTC